MRFSVLSSSQVSCMVITSKVKFVAVSVSKCKTCNSSNLSNRLLEFKLRIAKLSQKT